MSKKGVKKYLPFYALEAAICLALAFFHISAAHYFTAVMSFPFEQIGCGLRRMSLSGDGGNIIAIALYIVLSLVPGIIMLFIRKKRRLHAEDFLLPVISGLLFLVLYQMINPGLLSMAVAPSGGIYFSGAKAMAGMTIYSTLFAYAIIRLLRLFFSSQTEHLQKYTIRLLLVLNAVLVYLVFGVGVSEFVGAVNALKMANVVSDLGTSYLFLTLKLIADSIPLILDIAVVFSIISLLKALMVDRYSEEAVKATLKLSKVCKASIAATVVIGAAFNILQFVFKNNLNKVSIDIYVPLFSILLVLAVLLLSRFVIENKALKDDNDSII